MFPLSWLRRTLDFDTDVVWRRRRIEAFQLIFILIVGTEYWCRALGNWDADASPPLLATASTLCLVALLPRFRRGALLAVAGLHLTLVTEQFPQAGNHAYLEIVICLLIALFDLRIDEEQKLFLVGMRWIMFVVFFYSGMQKLVHGYYFYGQYFASTMPQESFRKLFQYILPADELQRLVALRGKPGEGPYALRSPLGLIVSNCVWIGELTFSLSLLVRTLRPMAVAGIFVLLFAIEIGAREAFFGLVFLNGLLLFAPARLHWRALPVFTIVLIALLLIRVGVLPEVTFY